MLGFDLRLELFDLSVKLLQVIRQALYQQTG
jgi:hypothetical protein